MQIILLFLLCLHISILNGRGKSNILPPGFLKLGFKKGVWNLFLMHKNGKGFTLVEVVVVSVIVGILAAVGVPMLVGYLDAARRDTARSTCELIAAGVSHNHNRGIDIGSDNWPALGIANPSDATWTYHFGVAYGALDDGDNLYGSSYDISAARTGNAAKSGNYFAFEQPPRWTGCLQ